jgi:hypothetical protein
MRYGIKYETQDEVVRWHDTLATAAKDMAGCRKAARLGGDVQDVGLIVEDDDGTIHNGHAWAMEHLSSDELYELGL